MIGVFCFKLAAIIINNSLYAAYKVTNKYNKQGILNFKRLMYLFFIEQYLILYRTEKLL